MTGTPTGRPQPAAAFDAFLPGASTASASQKEWTPADGPMPALYLSHGSPMLFAWAQRMPRPRAVVVVSAHWEDAPLCITSPAPGTPLVYDFYGFPRRLYDMEYATPDAGELAARVKARFADLHIIETPRGLDHGTWVPMKVMYPNADIPVIQLSMPTGRPDVLFQVGQRLAELRAEGVLVIGSGHMTHGMRSLTRDMMEHNTVPAWSSEFDAWALDAVQRGDLDTLANFRTLAPGMPYAHPTPDHFLPLFITLGAVDGRTDRLVDGVDGYAVGFSRRSFALY